MQMFNPAHPGLILKEYMGDSYTVTGLAQLLGMTRANLSMILNGRLGISAAMAIKLAEVFPKSDAEFWLSLQTQHDLAVARNKHPKRSSPDYERATIYVRKETRKAARRKWEDTKGGDFSELVQQLLTDYLSA